MKKKSRRVRWVILGKCNYLEHKKSILTSKIREIKPSLSQIKANVKYMYNYEKFSFQMKDKENIFLRRWGVYTDQLDT